MTTPGLLPDLALGFRALAIAALLAVTACGGAVKGDNSLLLQSDNDAEGATAGTGDNQDPGTTDTEDITRAQPMGDAGSTQPGSDAGPAPSADALPADPEEDAAAGAPDAPPAEEEIVEGPAPPPPVVRRVSPWPGRGLQIYVERPEPGLSIEFKDGSGNPYPAAVTQLPELSGLTVIALEGTSDLWAHVTRQDRARTLAEGLPEGERIAVWFNGQLASDFTERRAHVVKRILELLPLDSDPAPIEDLEDLLAEIEGPYGAVHRDLVVIGDTPEDELTAEEIVARRSTMVRVGVCPNMEEGAPFILNVGDATALLEAPEPMEAMIWVPCSAAAAAIDSYPYGDEIRLYMDDEEYATFQSLYNSNNKADWNVKVAIGPGLPETAVGHTRGNSSLSCDRKSITINLDGGDPRRIVPGGADDEFILISMCLDDRYFQQFLANHLLQSLGLFLPRQRYVRVMLNGEDMGVYLLLENPTETIRRRHATIQTVLRRRNEANGVAADVKWPSDPDEANSAREWYEGVMDLIGSTDASALPDVLGEHIEMDMFIQWLAFHTYVRNGDYVDELFLYASQENDGWMFRPSGWDADDLLSNCHHGGQNALDDPWNIYYCAEGDLEFSLIKSPELYERFIADLEALIINVMPYEVIASTIIMVRDSLFTHLEEESVCSVMSADQNSSLPSTCAGARADIDASMQDFLSGLSTRSTTLLDRIATYKGL